jgi:four helix bundle protein
LSGARRINSKKKLKTIMTTIKNFEDLIAWQKARELAGIVYKLTRQDKFSCDFGLRDQIQRAASSVMHNIAEGFESGSDPEFVRFLKMARRSAGEVQSELYLALDISYITEEDLKKHMLSQRRSSALLTA